jgi:hypothetical protein
MLLGLRITISLLLTQRRSWVILQYLGNKITQNSIAMPTDEQSNTRSSNTSPLSSSFYLHSRRANTPVERNEIELQEYSAHDAVKGFARDMLSLVRGLKIKSFHLVFFRVLAILNM